MNNPFSYRNRKKVEFVWKDHLICPICYSKEDVEIGESSNVYPWLITLKCTNNVNHPTWHVCMICKTGVRKRMMTKRSVKLHHRKYHPSNNNGSTDDVLTCVDNSNFSTMSFGESLETLNESNAINKPMSKDDVTSVVEFLHMNQHSVNFSSNNMSATVVGVP